MNTASSLAARLAADAQKAADAALTASARTMVVANAWDACGFTGVQPWHVNGAKGVYGDAASLSFRDVCPDELTELMRAFPAIPRITYSHSNIRYFHPAGARNVPENVTVEELDGYEIEISGGHQYSRFTAHWSAMVGETQTAFRAELRRIHWLHPRANRKAVMLCGHTFVRYEGRAELVWPAESRAVYTAMRDSRALVVHTYYAGDQSSGDFRIRGANVLALVEAWESEANKRGEQTQAAFLAAYAHVTESVSADDIAAQVDACREIYAREKLRAGTLEQFAALRTAHAEADRAVAEKHWPSYAKARGIETGQTYFDHFAWACAYLKRCGLYEVQIAGREAPYKYGHAWL